MAACYRFFYSIGVLHLHVMSHEVWRGRLLTEPVDGVGSTVIVLHCFWMYAQMFLFSGNEISTENQIGNSIK